MAVDIIARAMAASNSGGGSGEVGDYIPTSQKGANNGVATLDGTGKVPSSQLPSYVDDVLEFDSLSTFPVTGEDGKIYIDKTTSKTYRWSGTEYVPIVGDLALGETSSTAYAGDKGKAVTDKVEKIINGTTTVPKANDSNTVSGHTVEVNVPADAKFTDTIYNPPSSYPATMIEQDATHRFVTDSEKNTWNTPVTKETLGLNNVTNDAQIKRSEMGTANGVATLDGTGKVVQNLAVLPRVITTKQILTYDFSNQIISLTKGLITIDEQIYNGAAVLIFKHNLLLYEGGSQDYTITSNQISLNEPLTDGEMIYVVLIKSALSY